MLTGPLFNEAVRMETARPHGPEPWATGVVGTQSERFRRVAPTGSDRPARRHPVLHVARETLERGGCLYSLQHDAPARFPWNEVRQVAHYHLTASALTLPRVASEPPPSPHGAEE